jgi:hypothetical protein
MYLCRKAGIKDLKETFWLLLRLWAKVTRSAERNKGRGYKAFEWRYMHSHAGAWERDHRTPP